jgi:hypothetical protein
MPNGDTPAVEEQTPEEGTTPFPPDAPAQQPTPTPVGPITGAQQPLEGGGMPGTGALDQILGDLSGMMRGGMQQAQPAPPMGAQIAQRHGGLLTGLAGVLMDGLRGAMAPSAAAASAAPMAFREQQMRQQELQLRQQQEQEIMREAPMREAAMKAQTMINLVHAWASVRDLKQEIQLGYDKAQRDMTDAAVKENRAQEIGHTDTLAQAQDYIKQQRAQDPNNAMSYSWLGDQPDQEGNYHGYTIIKFAPKGTLQSDLKVDIPGDDALGIPAETKTYKAGTDANQAHWEASNLLAERGISLRMASDRLAQQREERTAAHQEETERHGRVMEGLASTRETRMDKQLALREAGGLYQASLPDGRQVAGTPEQLQAIGLGMNQISKQGVAVQNQTFAARELIAPDGLFATARQQALDLDQKGKLGPIASRWNNFWAKKGLEGDQQAFRSTLDKIATKMMQAHMAGRGGIEAIREFQTLIPENSTAPALMTELNNEYQYMRSQAKIIPQGLAAPNAQR